MQGFRRAVIAAIAVAAFAATPASAADYQVPDADGWNYTANEEGFTDGGTACWLLNFVDACLAPENTHNPDDGFPKGSLRTAMLEPANAQRAIAGQGTWKSPSFTVPATQKVGAVTVFADHKAYSGADVLDAGAAIRADVVLVDETNGNARTLLLRDELGEWDLEFWIRRTREIATESIVPGNTYHLLLTSVITTDGVQVLGETGVGWDNVRLQIAETAGTPGPAGPQGPAGSGGGSIGPSGGPSGPGTSQVLNNSSTGGGAGVNSPAARKLLAIRGLKKLRLKGGFARQFRVRVFCRKAVARRCEGTVRVRSIKKILQRVPRKKGKGFRRIKRKITFGVGSYQIERGKITYAKALLTPAYKRLLLKKKRMKVHAIVTVFDQFGRQQTLRRKFTLRTARR